MRLSLRKPEVKCQVPMPLHIDTAPSPGEVHVKAASRSGGLLYAVKVASLFPENATKGLSTGNGLDDALLSRNRTTLRPFCSTRAT